MSEEKGIEPWPSLLVERQFSDSPWLVQCDWTVLSALEERPKWTLLCSAGLHPCSQDRVWLLSAPSNPLV